MDGWAFEMTMLMQLVKNFVFIFLENIQYMIALLSTYFCVVSKFSKVNKINKLCRAMQKLTVFEILNVKVNNSCFRNHYF
jgi:hypothetical protein